VGIGPALADARWRVHLTVSEVSRETRIREAIIWAIEEDDFSACGGHAYARGHIRAIARAIGMDPDPLIQEYDATYRSIEDIEEVVVLHPATAAGMHGGQRRHRLAWAAALGVVVLAIVGWAGYHVATSGGHAASGAGLAAANRTPSHNAGKAPAGHGTPKPSAAPTLTPSSAAPVPVAVPVPAAVPVQILRPARVAAFGPGGPATGDNPRRAAMAVDGSRATAWRSDWYTTAAFGNLKPGTGLLLDMGRRVTITSAQIMLGISGANVQLRAGNVPVLANLREVAGAAGAGGTVGMWPPAAVRARYILIWFTRLPPDDSGTYQAAVYSVHLHGHV
jgi:cytoskeletal protein RodZ